VAAAVRAFHDSAAVPGLATAAEEEAAVVEEVMAVEAATVDVVLAA
jgi:hypothetical protein